MYVRAAVMFGGRSKLVLQCQGDRYFLSAVVLTVRSGFEFCVCGTVSASRVTIFFSINILFCG